MAVRVRALLALVLMLGGLVAPGAAAPLEAYARLPEIEQAALSRSGMRYAVVRVAGGARSLAVHAAFPGSSASPLLRIDLPGEKVRAIDWAGDDLVLLWTSTTASLNMDFAVRRQEILEVSVVNLSRRTRSRLLQRRDMFSGVFGNYGVVEQDGRWYGYFKAVKLERLGDRRIGPSESRFPRRNPDLVRVDLATGATRVLAKGSESQGRRDWVIGRSGDVLATLDFWSENGRWRLRAGQLGPVIASGVNPLGDVALVAPGRVPGTIVYFVRDTGGVDRWLEASLKEGRAEELLTDNEVASVWVDPATQLLIGYTREADIREERFFDSVRQARLRAARSAFAGHNVALTAHSDRFDLLIVRTTGPRDPGSWWLFDARTGARTRIGHAYPEIAPDDVGAVRTIAWRAADGLGLEGVLTLPPHRAPSRLPLVVLPHGGPTARDYPVFDWWAQAFASRGYAVLQPNFRGSSGYGAAFRQAGKREWGGKMQSDVSDGVAELARQGVIDAQRVCIVGASYGGYAALVGVTLQQGLYRCAVAVAGVSDLAELFRYDQRRRRSDRTLLRAWRADIGAAHVLPALSPARHAARADAPILLIHGRDDTVVPIAQSRIMARALRQAGKPVTLVELEGEDHWLSREKTRTQMLVSAVGFVELHNPAGDRQHGWAKR